MGIFIYFLAAAGVFAFNILDDTYAPYVTDTAFLAVTAVCLFTAAVLRHGVRVSASIPSEKAVIGKEYKIRLVITNRTFLPVLNGSVIIEMATVGNGRRPLKKPVRKSIKFSCSPKNSETVEYVMTSSHCENVTLKVKKYISWDFLHVFGFAVRHSSNVEFSVFPEAPVREASEDIMSVISGENTEIFSDSRPGNEPSELFGIRDYENSDEMRNIHWKLSARNGKLMVKEHGLLLTDRNFLVIDKRNFAGEDALSLKQRDEMAGLMYALSQCLVKSGYVFHASYCSGGYISETIKTIKDIDILFSNIYSSWKINDGMNISELFSAVESEKKQRVIYYAAECYDDDAVRKMTLLTEKGTVYYIIPEHTGKNGSPVRFSRK